MMLLKQVSQGIKMQVVSESLIGEVVGLFHDGFGKDHWCQAYDESLGLIMDEMDIFEEHNAEKILDKIMKENHL